MNDKLSDDDREIVSKAMMRDDKSALDLNRAMAAFIIRKFCDMLR